MSKTLDCLLFFLLVSVKPVCAQDLGQQTGTLNKEVNGGSTYQWCHGCGLTLAGVPDNSVKTCIESICQNPNFSLEKLNDSVYSNPALSAQFDKELAATTKKLVDKKLKNRTRDAQDLLNWLDTSPKIQDRKAVIAFNFFSFLASMSKFKYKLDGDKIVVDSTLSRSQFLSSSDSEFSRWVVAGNVVLPIFLKDPLPTSDLVRLKLIYQGAKFKNQIESVYKEVLRDFQKTVQSAEFGPFFGLKSLREQFDVENMKTRYLSENVTAVDLSDLQDKYKTLKTFLLLQTDKNFQELFSGRQLDIKKESETRGITNKLKEFLEKQRQPNFDGDTMAGFLCRAAVATGNQFLPTEEEVASFRKREPILRDRFKAAVGPLFSEHSRSILLPLIDSWKLSEPLTQNSSFSNIKNALAQQIAEANNEDTQREEISRSKDKDLLWLAALAFVPMTFAKEEMFNATDVRKACQQLTPEALPDAALSGQIAVGGITVKYPEAEGIYFHELGHLLYGEISSKTLSEKTKGWFDRSRSCLLENHSELSDAEVQRQREFVKRFGVSQYEVEDWADLISAHASKSNFACLLNRLPAGRIYLTAWLRNPNPNDSHSSSFSRLLHIQKIKQGNLPPVCLLRHKDFEGQPSAIKDCTYKD